MRLPTRRLPEPRQDRRSSEEVLPLLLPRDRERLQELRQPRRRAAVENALDDVGGKEREAQHATHVGAADPFGVGQIGEGPILTALQPPLPAVRTREGLDQCAVRLRLSRVRKLAPVGCDASSRS
jgi:hypothetical protein